MLGTRQAIFAKARKLPKQSPELKADLEAFEARLDADAAEVAEEEAASAAAAAAQAEAAAPQEADGAAGGEGGDSEEASMEDGDEGEAAEAQISEEGELLLDCQSRQTRAQHLHAVLLQFPCTAAG